MWEKIWKALSGLVMEHGSGRFSVGRLAFWPVLIVALWEWGVNDHEIQLYHFLTLVLLLVYNTGSKMLTVIREVKSFAAGVGVNVAAMPPQADKLLEVAAKAGDAVNAAEELEPPDEDPDDPELGESETAGG
jgi:hypothetical protein